MKQTKAYLNTFTITFEFLAKLNADPQNAKELVSQSTTTTMPAHFDTTLLRTERRAADDDGFTKGGLTCFVETFVVNGSVVLRMNFSGENPRHRKSVKR